MSNTDSTAPYVLVEDNGPVRRLTLNRAAQRNPLSTAMMTALEDQLHAARTTPDVAVIVLAAHGPAFCAGHDLKEIQIHRDDADQGAGFYRTLFDQCGRLMTNIATASKPVIAEIRGMASAAGCQLVASCDLALCSTDARFATPGVDIGLFCSTPMVALSRAIPRKAAMEMLLTADPIDAQTAYRFGLVNRLCPDSELTATVNALAQKIAAKSRAAMATGKLLFQAQMDMALSDAYAAAAQAMITDLMSGDSEMGIDAFLSKTAPVWTKS
jgi:enoyl-CoA hydratase/carnithine racemase